MSKYELTKSIEGRKVNKRTGNLMQGYAVTIPYGSMLVNVEYDGELVRFDYLDNRFQCASDVVKGFLNPMGKPLTEAPDAVDVGETAEPQAVVAPPGAEPVVDAPALVFEAIPVRGLRVGMARARVPGGWLVATAGGGVTFLPDAEHVWEISN